MASVPWSSYSGSCTVYGSCGFVEASVGDRRPNTLREGITVCSLTLHGNGGTCSLHLISCAPVVQNLTAAVQLVDSVQSSTVDTLFNLFDQNHNGTIELCEVSWGLHKLKPQMPQDDARQQALQHFLLFDYEESRCALTIRPHTQCVRLPFCLSVCLSVYLSACLSACLSALHNG